MLWAGRAAGRCAGGRCTGAPQIAHRVVRPRDQQPSLQSRDAMPGQSPKDGQGQTESPEPEPEPESDPEREPESDPEREPEPLPGHC